MKTTDQQLHALIEAFVADLSAIVQSTTLDAVRQAIQSIDSSRPVFSAPRALAKPAAKARMAVSSKASAGAAPARRGRKPDPQTERAAEMLLEYIKANPGQRLEEIGQGLRTPTAKLKRGLVRLINLKQLRTEGKRRGTRYFSKKG